MIRKKSQAKELIRQGSAWFFLSRRGWIGRMMPLVTTITIIYTIFLLGALIKIVEARVDGYLVLIGFTVLLQLFAIPALKISRAERSQWCLVYLVINGLSMIGFCVVTVLNWLDGQLITFKSLNNPWSTLSFFLCLSSGQNWSLLSNANNAHW